MAESKISKEFVVKEYPITTSSNPSVSPFGAYEYFSHPIDGYKSVSASVSGVQGTNPVSLSIGTSGTGHVWSKSAFTGTLRITYQRI